MQLIGMRQQADILGGKFAGKPLHGALTPLELACLEIVLRVKLAKYDAQALPLSLCDD